jgi:phosphoribosylaminoimidazole-succinocarboxamide synthase
MKMVLDERLLTPEVLANTLSRQDLRQIMVSTASRQRLDSSKIKEGKVRTVMPLGDGTLLMAISDHISAFNYVLNSLIYSKGANLNEQSEFFFRLTQDIVPNHIMHAFHRNAWIVREADPILVEVVLRQYLTGSGWKDYKAADGPNNGAVLYGQQFRPGYRENERLDELVITPTTKGPGSMFKIPEFAHLTEKELAKDDLPINRDIIMKNYRAFHLRSPEDWERIETIAKVMFRRIAGHTQNSNHLFVDSKWEFGYDSRGNLMLIDESATCDSSRFWDASLYGYRGPSNNFLAVELSKEVVRKHLKDAGWDNWSEQQRREYKLPDDVIKRVIGVYSDITQKVTGTELGIATEPIKTNLKLALIEKLS